MSTDANTGKSFNRYSYAANSPYKYIDPDGREVVSGDACLLLCVGVSAGFNRVNREFAVTVNLGAGVGGGVQVDLRPDENGRMNPVDSNSKLAPGVTVAGYGKVEVTAGIATLGAKVGGGKDLVTGEKVGGLTSEAGVNKKGAEASIQGGVEVSLHFKPADIAKKVENVVSDAVSKLLPKLIQ